MGLLTRALRREGASPLALLCNFWLTGSHWPLLLRFCAPSPDRSPGYDAAQTRWLPHHQIPPGSPHLCNLVERSMQFCCFCLVCLVRGVFPNNEFPLSCHSLQRSGECGPHPQCPEAPPGARADIHHVGSCSAGALTYICTYMALRLIGFQISPNILLVVC